MTVRPFNTYGPQAVGAGGDPDDRVTGTEPGGGPFGQPGDAAGFHVRGRHGERVYQSGGGGGGGWRSDQPGDGGGHQHRRGGGPDHRYDRAEGADRGRGRTDAAREVGGDAFDLGQSAGEREARLAT